MERMAQFGMICFTCNLVLLDHPELSSLCCRRSINEVEWAKVKDTVKDHIDHSAFEFRGSRGQSGQLRGSVLIMASSEMLTKASRFLKVHVLATGKQNSYPFPLFTIGELRSCVKFNNSYRVRSNWFSSSAHFPLPVGTERSMVAL